MTLTKLTTVQSVFGLQLVEVYEEREGDHRIRTNVITTVVDRDGCALFSKFRGFDYYRAEA